MAIHGAPVLRFLRRGSPFLGGVEDTRNVFVSSEGGELAPDFSRGSRGLACRGLGRGEIPQEGLSLPHHLGVARVALIVKGAIGFRIRVEPLKFGAQSLGISRRTGCRSSPLISA